MGWQAGHCTSEIIPASERTQENKTWKSSWDLQQLQSCWNNPHASPLASVLPSSSYATSCSDHNGLHLQALSHHWVSGWNTLSRSSFVQFMLLSPQVNRNATSPQMHSKGLLVLIDHVFHNKAIPNSALFIITSSATSWQNASGQRPHHLLVA